jgi:hypothetical protein
MPLFLIRAMHPVRDSLHIRQQLWPRLPSLTAIEAGSGLAEAIQPRASSANAVRLSLSSGKHVDSLQLAIQVSG